MLSEYPKAIPNKKQYQEPIITSNSNINNNNNLKYGFKTEYSRNQANTDKKISNNNTDIFSNKALLINKLEEKFKEVHYNDKYLKEKTIIIRIIDAEMNKVQASKCTLYFENSKLLLIIKFQNK